MATKIINKQADDLPKHALTVMKATLDLCGEVFPNYDRATGARIFTNAYFNPPTVIKESDMFTCGLCRKKCPRDMAEKHYSDGMIVCEICVSKD